MDKKNNENSFIDPFSQKPSFEENLNSSDADEVIKKEKINDDDVADKNLQGEDFEKLDREVNDYRVVKHKWFLFLIALGAITMIWYVSFAQPLAYDTVQAGQGATGSWDVGFIDMYEKSRYGSVEEVQKPSFDHVDATFFVSLSAPGDKITYDLTIKNSGTIDAKVASIYVYPENEADDAILYYVNDIHPGDVLNAGDKTHMTVSAVYNPNKAVSNAVKKSFRVQIIYVQK